MPGSMGCTVSRLWKSQGDTLQKDGRCPLSSLNCTYFQMPQRRAMGPAAISEAETQQKRWKYIGCIQGVSCPSETSDLTQTRGHGHLAVHSFGMVCQEDLKDGGWCENLLLD